MKIRVVNSRDEIAKLDPRERVVHLVAPPTTLVLLELINRCTKLEVLEVRGVTFFEGTIQGYRSATGDHYTVDEGSILQRAGELRAEGLDSGEIVA
ncbi:MAG: DUF1699 family protein, partial [Methanothrix sp.]